MVAPLHSARRIPTFTGDVHKSMSYMLILVQLNKCVVCGSVLVRGHSGYGCLSKSVLFKYECKIGHLFVLSLKSAR